MSNHGSILFSTWHQWQRGIHRPCLLESSPIGKAGVSVRELLTGIYIKTRSCQCYGVDKARFLISGILCPSPKRLCSCRLAGNSSLGKRVTDPPLMMVTHRHIEQALAIHRAAQLWQWPHVKNGGGLQFKWKGRQFQRANCFRLWISVLWEARDLRSNLCFTETS